MTESVTYEETPETVRAVSLANTSIEVGHLYLDELADDHRVRSHFRRVRPLLDGVLASVGAARSSTCVLPDDYSQRTVPANEAVSRLLRIAAECGVPIDYIVRESGCDTTDDGVQVAELAYFRLLPEPPPGANGSRPLVQESGWLCNGYRSDDNDSDQAIYAGGWKAPFEFAKRDHSVFLDVELVTTDGESGKKQWSRAFLSTVWQLLRLGHLRHFGEPIVTPVTWEEGRAWPEGWDDLPWVVQLNPDAEAFSAYRTVSIIPSAFLPVEHAVRMTLGHLMLDERETDQVVERGAKENLIVPRSVVKRTTLVLYGEV